jgi:DNA-binding protein YbaB
LEDLLVDVVDVFAFAQREERERGLSRADSNQANLRRSLLQVSQARMILRQRHSIACSVFKIVGAILMSSAFGSTNVLAFQPWPTCRATAREMSIARPDVPSSTALRFMNWFGFGKDGDANDSNNKDSTSDDGAQGALTGVASIMESMDSYKRSQRIGKMTGALTQELRSTTVEGVAENGKVKVIFDCQQRPVSTFIDEGFLEATDASDIAAAITTAMKDAHTKSIEKMDERMKNFFVELGLPSTTG